MKLHLYTLVIASMFFIIPSCKSASKLYDRGNYEEAIQMAVKKLQKDPNDGEMKGILQDAYRQAIQNHEHTITELANNNNELKWEWTYNEYVKMQQLANLVKRSPAAERYVKPADYSSYISTYQKKAGEVHYDNATKWMLQDDKLSYRKAYREFQAALAFMPGNFDVQQKIKEAYDAAVVHVSVIPADRFRGYQYGSYQFQNLENDLVRNLQNNINNEFVKFHSSWEASNFDIDQVIEMYYNQFNIGRIKDERNSRQVSKEVVIKEVVYKKDSVVKEYAKVTANITITNRTMNSIGNLMVNIKEPGGRVLWGDNISGDHQWKTEFATFTGDERALSDSDKQIINRKENQPPKEDEIIEAINRRINDNLLIRLRDFYGRY